VTVQESQELASFLKTIERVGMLDKEKIRIVEESHGSRTVAVLVIETDLSLDASGGSYDEPAVIQFFNDVREYMKAGSSAGAVKIISVQKQSRDADRT
jgi:hypothetical protein